MENGGKAVSQYVNIAVSNTGSQDFAQSGLLSLAVDLFSFCSAPAVLDPRCTIMKNVVLVMLESLALILWIIRSY